MLQRMAMTAQMAATGFPIGDIVIRPARREEATAIADLHLKVWRATYAGIAPQAVFDALDEAARRVRWEAVMADEESQRRVLVAEDGGALVALAVVCAPTEAAFGDRAEARWVYVDEGFKGRGLGRRLMGALARPAGDWGYGGVALGAVVGNDAAVRFSDAPGGCGIGSYGDPGPIWKSQNVVFAWDDLGNLMAL